MPVSDDAHAEVLRRLDNQDRMLRQIDRHGRQTNGRIGAIELVQALDKDRREQAAKQTDRGLSRRAQWTAALTMLAGWATIVALFLAHA